MGGMGDMPVPVARLPRDRHDRPVPWFVAVVDGEPDFRVIGQGRINEAVARRRCWVCGQALGAVGTFVIGPMCAVNRVSAEPPSHHSCALYSVTHCPFLTTPNMVRRTRHLPDGVRDPAGIAIAHNPGVALLWTTRVWSVFRPDRYRPGVLFRVGPPLETLWYAQGRLATRAEVDDAVGLGLPLLRREAARDGIEAVAQLDEQTATLVEMLDAYPWPEV